MNRIAIFTLAAGVTWTAGCGGGSAATGQSGSGAHNGSGIQGQMKELTAEEKRVIEGKGTEAPFSGDLVDHKGDGVYQCKRCGVPLFRSSAKFDSGSGWPSFDDAIDGAVSEIPDADGHRTEIVCANCGAHLGHVFRGEQFTDKDTRHCVNSVSLDFVGAESSLALPEGAERAVFAGGCFWGVEYYLGRVEGVLSVTSGYIGGRTSNPTYNDVKTGRTGHAEAVEVVYDPGRVDFEKLARIFFEIHDPTQLNRQGPDVGTQYRSAVFYQDEEQKQVTERLIGALKAKGFNVVTEVTAASTFWPAEDYHQDYYDRLGSGPTCHVRESRF